VRGGASITGLYPLTQPENRALFEAWLERQHANP